MLENRRSPSVRGRSIAVIAVAVAVAGCGSSSRGDIATLPGAASVTTTQVAPERPTAPAPPAHAAATTAARLPRTTTPPTTPPATAPYPRTRAGLAPLAAVLPGGCTIEHSYSFGLAHDADVADAQRVERLARTQGARILSRYREGAPFGFTARLSRAALRVLRQDPQVAYVAPKQTQDEDTCAGADRHRAARPSQRPRQPGQLAPLHSGGPDAIEGDYIVELLDGTTVEDIERVERVARAHGADIKRMYGSDPYGFSGPLPDEALDAVRSDPAVAGVWQNGRVQASTTQTNPPWGLDRIDQPGPSLDGAYRYFSKGSGVTAYVIDSGIRTTHQDFGGRATLGANLAADGRSDDCFGHGTQVAGIIGGSTYGVAKNVGLVSVRVLDCAGSGLIDDIVNGLHWVRDIHQPGQPAVANVSFDGTFVQGGQLIDAAVEELISDGVTVVTSAGNQNTCACLATPAHVEHALTVGATTILDARRLDSNYGSLVDVFAPGDGILSPSPTSNTAAVTFSGTSAAAPHVAGVVARYLELAPAKSPAAIQAQVVDRATAGVVSDPGPESPNRLLRAPAETGVIRLQAGTAIRDSELYANVMAPGYSLAQPGDAIVPSFVGTGAALDNARAGLADVVITSAPLLEKDFVNSGYSEEPLGRALFYNDYVIVGPTADPAGVIAGGGRNDAVKALSLIANWGSTHTNATFISRNDRSATNVQEQILWKLVNSNLTVPNIINPACNAAGDTARSQPAISCGATAGGDVLPDYYRYGVVSPGNAVGQGPILTQASACSSTSFPGRSGCYTMVDKGTWLALSSSNTNLKIVSSDNSAGAVGGAALQANLFRAYVVSDDKAYPNGETPNVAAALRLLSYLISPAFQGAVGVSTPARGIKDTTPKNTALSSPSCVPNGAAFNITATFRYAPPPTPVIVGLPVTLTRTTGVGAPVTVSGTTNASGVASFSLTGPPGAGSIYPPNGAATTYQLKTSTYDDNDTFDFARFTAIGTDVLGVVTPAINVPPLATKTSCP